MIRSHFIDLSTATYHQPSSLPPPEAYARFVGLKAQNPRVKALIAIGGWTEGSSNYSTMASTRQNRRRFIDSVVTFLQ